MSELESLRAEIDAIDDELIALLNRRLEIVTKVGDFKRAKGTSGLFIRPGREGHMHQRIVDAFKGSAYPPEAMLGIWRLLIAASTHHESPMKLGLLQTADEPELPSLAREYFGSFMESRNYASASTILADLYDSKIDIAIVPYPRNDANWWQQLAQYQENKALIFARLPILAGRPNESAAMAIGRLCPEASDADESFYVLRTEETVSTSKLQTAFQTARLKAEFINAANHSPMRSVLVKLDGFYPPEASAIEALRARLEAAELIWLGAHPKAIER